MVINISYLERSETRVIELKEIQHRTVHICGKRNVYFSTSLLVY